jgi:DNA replication protein DnaC
MTMTSETAATSAGQKPDRRGNGRHGDMTSGATNTSSRSPTLIDLEVDAGGRARCPDCGEFAIETMVSPFTGNRMQRGNCCESCQEKWNEAERAKARERALAKARFRRENIEHLLARVGVIKRYLGCSLDNYKGKVPERRPAFITGTPGTGKSHLAVAYLREDLLAHGEEHGRFLRTVDLLKEIRDSFDDRSGDSEKRLLDYYGARVPFLVLDDLGAEKVSDFVLQTLYDLLDRRYGECLETLITSNLTLEELAVHYLGHGDRLASRIAGMGPTLILRGKDRRWQG